MKEWTIALLLTLLAGLLWAWLKDEHDDDDDNNLRPA